MPNPPAPCQPHDQADGLRRLFAHAQARFLPVVSNPHMAFGGVMLERLCTALAALGRHTLVVDAGERAPQPREWSALELADGVEALSADVAYLAARGLPLRFVDSQGSTFELPAGCRRRLAAQADVVLVHASAVDLSRMFAQADRSRCAAPLVLADERPVSVTHAYAAIKLLSQRGRQPVCDLLLSAADASPRAERIGAAARALCRRIRRCGGARMPAHRSRRPTPTSHRRPALRRWAGADRRRRRARAGPVTEAARRNCSDPSWPAAVTLAYQATEAAMALN